MRRERRVMYSVAVQRRQLEKESKRYVQWLKNLAKVDDDDMEMCDQLEKKLDVLSVCQGEYSVVYLCRVCWVIIFGRLANTNHPL